jgi:hypothetical protein
MVNRLRLLTPAGALVVWGALALAVQRWASIVDGVRDGYAVDVTSYLLIAEAAPSLPDGGVVRPFAERFPVHWLVGTTSELTGLGVESVYRVASLLCVAAILVAADLALRRLRLSAWEHVLALGVLAASAYPLHYLLAAPGMVTDGVFVLGLGLTLLGFGRISLRLVVLGLVVAVVGRQTAVPVAAAAALWIVAGEAWRPARWRAAAATLLAPVAVYLIVRTVADGFAVPRSTNLEDSTVVGYFDSLGEVADHFGRIVVGIAVPAALVLGAWLRRRPPWPAGPLLLAAAVVVQPLVLGPATNGNNEPRLAGLAVPALAVAAATMLRGAGLSRPETLLAAFAIALAGLHPRYTWPPPWGSGVWAAVYVAMAVAVAVAVSGRLRRLGERARDDAGERHDVTDHDQERRRKRPGVRART